jgi:hypothetical protein
MVEPIGFSHGVDADVDGVSSCEGSGASCMWRPRRAKAPGPTTFASRRLTLRRASGRALTYIATLLHGSLATLDAAEIEKNLAAVDQW